MRAAPASCLHDYWVPKLLRNKDRDRSCRSRLARLGWRSLVVWDCQTKDYDWLQKKLVGFLAN
jgi:DNA mismatch endonuclease (patch repair protein)